MTSKLTPESPAWHRCFERLVVIDDPEPRSGPVNMAFDELLLDEPCDGVPRLRFYRWSEPTVSFGWFEPVQDARRLASGRPVVRRPTGGGLVEHGDDLTYSVVVPRADPFVRLRPAESYRLIHAAVASALACAGERPTSHLDAVGTTSETDGNACFRRPVLHDLMADGHKIAGGAQRRTRAGLLHQGSVRIAAPGGAGWADAVRRFLPPLLARQCESSPLNQEERARAEALAEARYSTPEWTNRR